MPINIKNKSLKQKAVIAAKEMERAAKLPKIKKLANTLVSPRDVYAWIRKNIRYKKEDGDKLRLPRELIEKGVGDCEDLTVLAGSILKAKGYPVYIKIISDGNINHIYPLYKTGQGWIRMDLTPKGELSEGDIRENFQVVTSGRTSGLAGTNSEEGNDGGEWYNVFGVDIRKEMGKAVFTGLGLAVGNLIFDKFKKNI